MSILLLPKQLARYDQGLPSDPSTATKSPRVVENAVWRLILVPEECAASIVRVS